MYTLVVFTHGSQLTNRSVWSVWFAFIKWSDWSDFTSISQISLFQMTIWWFTQSHKIYFYLLSKEPPRCTVLLASAIIDDCTARGNEPATALTCCWLPIWPIVFRFKTSSRQSLVNNEVNSVNGITPRMLTI